MRDSDTVGPAYDGIDLRVFRDLVTLGRCRRLPNEPKGGVAGEATNRSGRHYGEGLLVFVTGPVDRSDSDYRLDLVRGRAASGRS